MKNNQELIELGIKYHTLTKLMNEENGTLPEEGSEESAFNSMIDLYISHYNDELSQEESDRLFSVSPNLEEHCQKELITMGHSMTNVLKMQEDNQ